MQITNREQSSRPHPKWSSAFGFAAAHALTASVTYWVLLPLFMPDRNRVDHNMVARGFAHGAFCICSGVGCTPYLGSRWNEHRGPEQTLAAGHNTHVVYDWPSGDHPRLSISAEFQKVA